MGGTLASRVWPALIAVAIATRLAAAAPPNDACTSATIVPDDFANWYLGLDVDLAAASVEPTEPVPTCTTPPTRSIWYEWTAPGDGALSVITLCNILAPYEVGVSVWDGTCDAPTSLGCGVGLCTGASGVLADVREGVTYLVQVGTDVLAPTSALTTQLCYLGLEEDDIDGDLVPDCLDRCTDEDFDGFRDGSIPRTPFDLCPEDNCPGVWNADQGDKDGDGAGDACDPDEEKDDKTLEEAAEDGDVELSDKDCFSGDCVRLTVHNRGTRPLRLNVRPGDVLVSRANNEQDLGVTKPVSVYVPPGGTASIGGIHTVCLQLDHHAPTAGRIYDVTDHLSAAADGASLTALLSLLSTPTAPTSVAEAALQDATWAITDGSTSYTDRAADLLRAVGLDPAALPTGFPDLPNPDAGSTEPTAHRHAGLLANASAGGCSGAPLAVAACLLDGVERLAAALPTDTVKPKLRAKIGRGIAGVRAKIQGALHGRSRAGRPSSSAPRPRARGRSPG